MNRTDWLDVSDAPVFCPNVPDYRAEALKEAREAAKKFGCARVLYNGLYYHVAITHSAAEYWKRKGYKVIHKFVHITDQPEG